MGQKLKITLRRSLAGSSRDQRAVATGLGLKRREHSVVRENTPAIRGMVKKIIHLLAVEEVD